MEGTARVVGGASVALALLTGLLLASGAGEGDPRSGNEEPSAPSASESRVLHFATPRVRRTPTAPTEPRLLLPNMRSLGASDLQIESVGQRRRLRFAASLGNLGPGPMLLRPRGSGDCAPRQRGAVQVLHQDRNEDGVFQRRRDRVRQVRFAGCMLDHPKHEHWHFDAMAAYSLRRAGSQDVLVARDKVSFCLRDNERVQNQPVVVRREYFGDCTRNSRQGISPGWIDIYTADLSGQWLWLPRGADSQVLCLDLLADPLELLVETVETDNGASVAIRTSGRSVRRVPSAACR